MYQIGHGMYPDMDPDHLKAYIDAVHHHSEQYIKEKLSGDKW